MKVSAPDKKVSESLQEIANEIMARLEQVAGQKMQFSLVVFNAEAGSRLNYVSNCDRKDVAAAWLALVEGWHLGMPDIPAHKIN